MTNNFYKPPGRTLRLPVPHRAKSTSKRVHSGRKNVKIYNKGLVKLTSGIFQDRIKGKIKFIQDIKNE